MFRLGAVALTLTLMLLGPAVCAAAPPPLVAFSEGVFHIPACPAPTTRRTARCHARLVTDPVGRPMEVRAAATDATTPPKGYGPADLRAAYGVTGMGSPATIIALVDAWGYPNAESDLAVYRAQFGLPACTTANGCFAKLNQSGVKGPYPKPYNGWERESALDLDMASAMCPNCKLILIEATSATDANLSAAAGMAGALGAHVISNSYGDVETGSMAYEANYDQPGVAVVASTGDTGYGVMFPAASPHVIAVGGTILKTSAKVARGWTETAWKGSGSGCSAVYAKPAWQTDPGCPGRMLADVSAVASPSTGVAVYGPASGGGSAWAVMAGTSVAAPLVGGIYAVNGGAVTYGSNPYADIGGLNDVTTGSNGTCAVAYFCTAKVGYDGPTGLGTPKGVNAF
jgi:subtilase family serine protease